MRALPQEDYHRLSAAMLAYRLAAASGFQVKNYGQGVMMIKDDSRGQGRCLFFTVRQEGGEEVLTALLVYKKEGQKAPTNQIAVARARMRDSQ